MQKCELVPSSMVKEAKFMYFRDELLWYSNPDGSVFSVSVYGKYKISISPIPSYHDNPYKPYWWVILGYCDNEWYNFGACGWAESLRAACDEAHAYFEEFISPRLREVR